MTDFALLKNQLLSLFESESDFLVNTSQFSAFVFDQLPELNWAGFYFLRGDELVLGPFQGLVACSRIPMGKGVCGTAAATKTTQRVDDVHAFPGHIACDSASNSEIVVPLIKDGAVIGVFDIDSPKLQRFSAEDEAGIVSLVEVFLEKTEFSSAGSLLKS